MEEKIVELIGGDYDISRCRISLAKIGNEYVVIVLPGGGINYFVVKAGEEHEKALATLNNVIASFCHVAKYEVNCLLDRQTGERTQV